MMFRRLLEKGVKMRYAPDTLVEHFVEPLRLSAATSSSCIAQPACSTVVIQDRNTFEGCLVYRRSCLSRLLRTAPRPRA